MTQATVGVFTVVAIVVLDLLLLFGLGLLVRLLRPVRRLTHAAHVLQSTALDVALGPSEPLGVMSSRLLFDLLVPKRRSVTALSDYLRFPVGRLIIIVHTSDATVKRVVKELQWYAFLVAILFIVGTIIRAAQLPDLSLTALVHDIGHNPLHVLDTLAVIALVLLGFRLASEVSRLSELLLPPH